MNREQKAAVIDEVAGQIASAEGIFAVDYRGITVAQIADLRDKLREADTTLRVVKNSLTERAADKAGAPELKPLLSGPVALALVRGDVALAAKALSDSARALRGPLEFKGGVLNGSLLSADQVRSIARLPAREILHAQLVGTIAAPLTGLVRALNGLIAGLAIALQEIAEKGLVSGEGRSSSDASGGATAGATTETSVSDASGGSTAGATTETSVSDASGGSTAGASTETDTRAASEVAPASEPEAAPQPEAAEPVVEAEAETPEATEASLATEQTENTEGEAASDAADPSDE